MASRLARGRLGQLLGFVGLILLGWNLLEFPRHPYDASHDLSSHATFEYYAANHFQFGKQVCLNVGPYGYAHYAYAYIGYLYGQKLWLRNGSRLLLLLLIFWVSRKFPHPFLRCCWWGVFFAFLPIGAETVPRRYLVIDEDYAYLALYLAALYLLQRRHDWKFYLFSAALVFYLAFTALTKHTFFVLAGAIAGTVMVQKLLERDFRAAALTGLLFPLFLAAHWVMAWQRLENLPLFVRSVFVFSGGYNETAACDESSLTLVLGLSIGLLLLARSVFNWLAHKEPVGRMMIEVFLLFVIWKHSCVRADALHLPILYYAALFLAPVFFLVGIQPPHLQAIDSSLRPRSVAAPIAGCVAVMVIALAAFFSTIPGCNYRLERMSRHLKDNLAWLLAPGEKRTEMASKLEEVRQDFALPTTKAKVGHARIDFFGYEPGYLLLNGLNYWPRPVPITFAAANEPLQRANEAFYRNPQTAPEYVLCKLGGMDVGERMHPQDDALALIALLDEYHPVLLEQDAMEDMVLLRRNGGIRQSAPARRQFIVELNRNLGDEISLAAMNGGLVWMEADIEYSLLGKVRAFLYKPPACYIDLCQATKPVPVARRFVPSMGRCGFLLSPFLGESSDLLKLYQPGTSRNEWGAIQSFTLRCAPGDGVFFRNQVRLRFYRVDEPGGHGEGLPEKLRALPDQEARLQEWLKSNPSSRMAHYKLGKLFAEKHELALAVQQWQEAIRLKPDWAEMANNLAWILATSADPHIRNGSEAVELAERACRSEAASPPPAGSRLPDFLDTLAAAYAESGRFDEAAKTSGKALRLATGAGLDQLAAALRVRVQLYQSGQPYRK